MQLWLNLAGDSPASVFCTENQMEDQAGQRLRHVLGDPGDNASFLLKRLNLQICETFLVCAALSGLRSSPSVFPGLCPGLFHFAPSGLRRCLLSHPATRFVFLSSQRGSRASSPVPQHSCCQAVPSNPPTDASGWMISVSICSDSTKRGPGRLKY